MAVEAVGDWGAAALVAVGSAVVAWVVVGWEAAGQEAVGWVATRKRLVRGIPFLGGARRQRKAAERAVMS